MGPVGSVHAPGATPPDPDEIAGLIPGHITTQADLNEWEQSNILEGKRWSLRQRRTEVLSEEYVVKLHHRMFNNTWTWAGTFRRTEKSIGADPVHISVRLHDLIEDVKAQCEHQVYSLDERAARLHHRLVLIHPFPNGNGRHARLFTDAFLLSQGGAPFSWGRVNLTNPSETRKEYIRALQSADAKDIEPLMRFVRS